MATPDSVQSGSGSAIDGVDVTSAAPAPATGHALRATTVIAASNGTATYAEPDGSGNLNVNLKAVNATVPVASSAGTSALSAVAASTSSVTLLAANGSRRAAVIVNDSATANMYLAFAVSSSTSLYTARIAPLGTYEMGSTAYTGAISAVWDAAVGNARITEVSP